LASKSSVFMFYPASVACSQTSLVFPASIHPLMKSLKYASSPPSSSPQWSYVGQLIPAFLQLSFHSFPARTSVVVVNVAKTPKTMARIKVIFSSITDHFALASQGDRETNYRVRKVCHQGAFSLFCYKCYMYYN
jgi:hypothetical protein